MKQSIDELYELAKDRTQLTDELHQPNDFYGNAKILKQYCKFPINYQIKAAIEHGPFLEDFVWNIDIQAPVPAMIFPASARFSFLRQKTNKALFAIGPILSYAPHYLDDVSLETERQRLNKNLLVFPAHSTHHVNADYDIHNYCRMLETIGKDFNTIRVCLYWKDILHGRAEAYWKHGFECVTAGHIFDPLFLSRLKSIIELSTITTSNEIGTHIGYCILMGKAHYFYKSSVEYKSTSEKTLKRDFQIFKGEGLELSVAFSELTEKIKPSQRELINKYWGVSDIKSVEEMQMILQATEDMYRKGPQFFMTGRDVLTEQALDYLNRGKHKESLFLLENATKINNEIPELHFAKALAFAQMGDTAKSEETLQYVLSVKPDFTEAQQLLGTLTKSLGNDGIRNVKHKTTLNPEDLEWIGVRFMDPIGRVFRLDNKYYRAIYPHAVEKTLWFFNSGIIDNLVNQGLLIETSISSDLHVEGYGMVLESPAAPYNTRVHEWNRNLIKDAALMLLDLNIELLKHGMGTIDAHYGNTVQIDNCRPVWVDLGSIIRITNPLTNIQQFVDYYIHPLYLISKSSDLCRMTRIVMKEHAGIANKEYFALTGQSIPISANRVQTLSSLKQILNDMKFEYDKTLWSDYQSEQSIINADENFTEFMNPYNNGNRQAIITRLMERFRPKRVIELGSNMGFYSMIGAKRKCDVLSIDSDETAVDKYYQIMKHMPDTLSTTSIVKNVLINDRDNHADFVLALALTHHLAITQSFPFSYIAEKFASYCTNVLVTEFMVYGLGGTRPVPNPLPENYSLDNFIHALSVYFKNIEIIDYPLPPKWSKRIIVVCWEKK